MNFKNEIFRKNKKRMKYKTLKERNKGVKTSEQKK